METRDGEYKRAGALTILYRDAIYCIFFSVVIAVATHLVDYHVAQYRPYDTTCHPSRNISAILHLLRELRKLKCDGNTIRRSDCKPSGTMIISYAVLIDLTR